ASSRTSPRPARAPAYHSPRICFLPALRARSITRPDPLSTTRCAPVCSVATVGVVLVAGTDRLAVSLLVIARIVLAVVAALLAGAVRARRTLVLVLAVLGAAVLAAELLDLALEDGDRLALVGGEARELVRPEQKDHQDDQQDDRPGIAEEAHGVPFNSAMTQRGHLYCPTADRAPNGPPRWRLDPPRGRPS